MLSLTNHVQGLSSFIFLARELQYATGVAIKKSILFFMILFTIFLGLILDTFAFFFFPHCAFAILWASLPAEAGGSGHGSQ